MIRITNLWQKFRGSIRGVDSSGQLAAGVAIGMMIGLVPKDSLIPYALILVLLISRANLLSATLAALVFSWVGGVLDPISHEIGIRVLTFDPFESTWAWLIDKPVVAWTRFDNTVVMGSFIIGCICAYPMYRLSSNFFQSFGDHIYSVLRNTRIVRWFVGRPRRSLSEA